MSVTDWPLMAVMTRPRVSLLRAATLRPPRARSPVQEITRERRRCPSPPSGADILNLQCAG